MPPYRTGLHKRKRDADQNKAEEEVPGKKEESGLDSAGEEDLMKGAANAEGDDDASDSEDEPGVAAASDEELDEVLFEDDTDSILSDVGQETGESFEDLSNSENDSDTNEESDDSYESHEEGAHSAKGKESTDSGAESEPVPGSSSEDSSTKQNTESKKKGKHRTKNKHKKSESSVDKLADKINAAHINLQPVEQRDEYESGDTSDEEDRRTTVGDVPLHWYREYPHVGYDLQGRRVLRAPAPDAIDSFLKQCEDPEFWRTVRDPSTGQDVVLAREDLQLLQRLRAARPPADEPHEPWVEWFSRAVLAAPLRAFPEHKRSFLPSRDERRHVARLVHALRMGWAKTRKQIADERRKRKEKQFYDLWGAAGAGAGAEAEAARRGGPRPVPAPRRPPPSHAESYNPPPEYLLDARERAAWDALAETPWRRPHTALPTRHASLRAVPAYPRYVRERFLRCLDLYLAPRAIKMRLTVTPEQLVPRLPAPRELQPFPTREYASLRGHSGLVRAVDFDPSGDYIVSGGDDGTVRVWESRSGRCIRTFEMEGSVTRVAWTPAPALALLAAVVGERLLLLQPGAGRGAGRRGASSSDELLREGPAGGDAPHAAWEQVTAAGWARGERLRVRHCGAVGSLAWHARGDYVCCTVGVRGPRAVQVHQLSRRRSQLPLARAKGLVQCAAFHPQRPHLFVATQRAVRIYDLVKQELVKKLVPGAQWISALAVHPAGDNLLVASYDRKCLWFDLELSSQPYQTLRLHGGAVRAAAFHKRYPLFATGGDDPYLVVSHGMVYNDLLQNPLLVPLKQLGGPERRGDLCVLALCWHPTQPMLLAAGADHTLRLYA